MPQRSKAGCEFVQKPSLETRNGLKTAHNARGSARRQLRWAFRVNPSTAYERLPCRDFSLFVILGRHTQRGVSSLDASAGGPSQGLLRGTS